MIACVGETLEQRESGSTMDVVAAQTKAIAGNFLLLTQILETTVPSFEPLIPFNFVALHCCGTPACRPYFEVV